MTTRGPGVYNPVTGPFPELDNPVFHNRARAALKTYTQGIPALAILYQFLQSRGVNAISRAYNQYHYKSQNMGGKFLFAQNLYPIPKDRLAIACYCGGVVEINHSKLSDVWLASVVAHEVRHAYQDMVQHTRFADLGILLNSWSPSVVAQFNSYADAELEAYESGWKIIEKAFGVTAFNALVSTAAAIIPPTKDLDTACNSLSDTLSIVLNVYPSPFFGDEQKGVVGQIADYVARKTLVNKRISNGEERLSQMRLWVLRNERRKLGRYQ